MKIKIVDQKVTYFDRFEGSFVAILGVEKVVFLDFLNDVLESFKKCFGTVFILKKQTFMRKLVKDLDGVSDTETFKASCTWFNKFKRRWGFSFQQKTNVKKQSVAARLPYVRKYHQYLLYKAFKEEPG